MELRNRSVRSATWTGSADENGYATDLTLRIYKDLAAGGVGLIVTGYQYIMTNGPQLPRMLGIYEDAQIEGLSRLASGVHEHGGSIIPQIVHTGSRADPKLFKTGDVLWAPSAIPDPVSGNVPVEMSKQDIGALVEAYAAAALRAQKVGFDGVQLHGAHGYGINQFLSPYWNQRGDAYGGSLGARYRLLGEIMEAVKAAVGSDFPVLIKLSGHDFVEGGLTPEDSVKIAQRLEADGITAIEVSGGNAASSPKLGPIRKKITTHEDEAYLSDIAAFFKRSVGVPIITVGGIRSLKVINDILSERRADYVAMSRPFIREPDLVNKWKSGESSTATCISCNGCFETAFQGLGVSCKVDRKHKDEE